MEITSQKQLSPSQSIPVIQPAQSGNPIATNINFTHQHPTARNILKNSELPTQKIVESVEGSEKVSYKAVNKVAVRGLDVSMSKMS